MFSWTDHKYKYNKALHTGWLVSMATKVLIALPLQQWLHKSVSMLRYTYIDCLDQKQLRCLRYPILILPSAQKLVVVLLPTTSLQLMESECPVPCSNESVILSQLYPVHFTRPYYSKVQKWHLHFRSFRNHVKLW